MTAVPTRRPASLSKAQARRIALAAQGFADPKPAVPDMRALSRVLRRLALLQIDSVNVATRAHYMPLFSRLGPYDRELLHRASGTAPRRLFEYWAHVASYVRVDLQPSLRFRMAETERMWRGMRRIAEERPDFLDWVLSEVDERGPLSARQIEDDAPRTREDWGWNWSQVKIALEWLFWTGQVTAARRNSAFERLYDIPERVLPKEVISAPTPTVHEAHRTLMRASAAALGVATDGDLRDYFRLVGPNAKQAITDLVAAGELLPVALDGSDRPAYLWHEARIPRRVEATALLSPFDSLIFERARTERLFDYRFRIEIYVPVEKRVYGYYVYSFLYDEAIVARVDLKADRAVDALRVMAAHSEPGAPGDTAVRLMADLEQMAGWLGLGAVIVHPRGDLAPALRRCGRS